MAMCKTEMYLREFTLFAKNPQKVRVKGLYQKENAACALPLMQTANAKSECGIYKRFDTLIVVSFLVLN